MRETGQLSQFPFPLSAIAFILIIGQLAAAQPREPVADSNVATSLSKSIRTAVERASPGVVTIYALRGPRMTGPWRMREHAEHQGDGPGRHINVEAGPINVSPDEQGSGIVIDKKGFILTCNHVVASADVLFVRLPDGRKIEPVEVWTDPETDLALIRVKTDIELQEVRLGNSENLDVGDWVVSLASPYDMTRSISAGIVSTTDRWVPGTPNPLIQNDAATNPGSSGGALINLRGEVVGVIIGGFSTRKEFQGIGLAIPIKTALCIADELRTNGQVRRGYLGCQTEMLAPDIAKRLELPVAGGIYVKDVEKDSPAEAAGIQQGDIFIRFDGHPIDDKFRPEKLYVEPAPGEKHTISLVRGGKTVTVEVEMGQQPIRNVDSPPMRRSTVTAEHFDKSLGLGVDRLESNSADELGLSRDVDGVLVSHVSNGGPAYKEGVAAGMAVLRIDDRAIHSLDDYKVATSERQATKPMLMLVQSNRSNYLVVFAR